MAYAPASEPTDDPKSELAKPAEPTKKASMTERMMGSLTNMLPISQDSAATKIGSAFRGKKEREELHEMEGAATLIQSRFRSKAARRDVGQLRASREVVTSAEATIKRKGNDLTSVNEYKFNKQLGKGAYGEVFKATKVQKGPDEQVAVKVISRSILRRKRVGRTGSAYDSVMGEIAVMKALHHPNIVRLYEVIDDPEEDLLFMVMELVRGGDLSEPYEKKRRVPEDEMRKWLRGLVLGLEHLHLSGVCHRDIKPENILYDPTTDCVKLSDFGISGFVKSDVIGGDFLDSTGGSLPFFAPEMCRSLRGAGYSGRAADIWACGVSLYMWMFHAMPYVADTIPNLLAAISNEEVSYPDVSGYSEELVHLLKGMLERAPKQRLRMRELRRDAFVTKAHAEPLPPPEAKRSLNVSVSKAHLTGAISRVKLMNQADVDRRRSSADLLSRSSAAGAPAAEAADELADEYAEETLYFTKRGGEDRETIAAEAAAEELDAEKDEAPAEASAVVLVAAAATEAPAAAESATEPPAPAENATEPPAAESAAEAPAPAAEAT